MYVYTYRCDTCQLTSMARSGRPVYYVFSDGVRLPARTLLAWCRHCSDFTSAEALPTPQELEDEISRLRSGKLTDVDLEHAKAMARDLASHISSRLVALIDFHNRFRVRHSENRCTGCGSTDFEYLEDAETAAPDQWPHAACGGTWRLIASEHASPATFFLLDEEGNRMSAS